MVVVAEEKPSSFNNKTSPIPLSKRNRSRSHENLISKMVSKSPLPSGRSSPNLAGALTPHLRASHDNAPQRPPHRPSSPPIESTTNVPKASGTPSPMRRWPPPPPRPIEDNAPTTTITPTTPGSPLKVRPPVPPYPEWMKPRAMSVSTLLPEGSGVTKPQQPPQMWTSTKPGEVQVYRKKPIDSSSLRGPPFAPPPLPPANSSPHTTPPTSPRSPTPPGSPRKIPSGWLKASKPSEKTKGASSLPTHSSQVTDNAIGSGSLPPHHGFDNGPMVIGRQPALTIVGPAPTFDDQGMVVTRPRQFSSPAYPRPDGTPPPIYLKTSLFLSLSLSLHTHTHTHARTQTFR